MRCRIMYIEYKGGGINGPARIGQVTFSKSGRSLYYDGKCFAKGKGFNANYFDVAIGEEYWISGCKKRGGDRLYGGTVAIDDDVRDKYWRDVRGMQTIPSKQSFHWRGKY
jgi:hypothetical protein